jgi:hypothetical protein
MPGLNPVFSWTVLFANGDELHLPATELPTTFAGYNWSSQYDSSLQYDGSLQVEIPASIRVIDDAAFRESQLTKITFPENSELKIIGDYAFYKTPLESIDIPDSVTTIRVNAFYDCSQLKSIAIPDSVTINSYSYAFGKCPFQTIKIKCNTLSNNNIATILSDMYNNGHCSTSNLDTLQVALSASLLAKKSPAQIKEYVAGILALENLTNNTIISKISTNSGLFELDLSNTELTQDDIAGMEKTLPWTVIFANEE